MMRNAVMEKNHLVRIYNEMLLKCGKLCRLSESTCVLFTNFQNKFPFQRLENNGGEAAEKDVEKVIELINTKIAVFDQKIELFEYGLDNSWYFIFCSTAKTSVSSLQNTYNADELYLFKMILAKITQNRDLNMAPRDVLNLTEHIQKFNKTQADLLLNKWLQTKYLIKHTDNQIYLGPKLLVEFKDLLQEMNLQHLRSCLLCENLAAWVSSKSILAAAIDDSF